MDFGELLKQAEKLKETFKQQQEEMARKVFEGESGGGMVRAKVNGKQEVLTLLIDPELLAMQDTDMLQDLVIGAINAAFTKARGEIQGLFSKLMMGGGMPPMGGGSPAGG